MNPELSIIIPCYNSEKTLEKTLASVLNQNFQNWEAIIVNDGSTDNTEATANAWVAKDKRFKYFSKPNEGLGKTRNFGISKAVGNYILPLDSDNLVIKEFGQEAIDLLNSNSKIGVVHGNAEYFGEKSGVWGISEFNLDRMLISNFIDACAIYRKELWEKVGGYDERMPYQGHEDWEFWIALGVRNIKFHHLHQITFKYFVSSNSMIRTFTDEMLVANRDYIVKKYSKVYHRKLAEKLNDIAHSKKQLDVMQEGFESKLKSEKFLINNLTKRLFGFTLFTIK
ncbi:glycosyltransferase [Dokdonia sinensis]|uniref:Glycosyltransferase n=1 Tax=Dokdonia sinensis TaxID=2479847 RepID=A0A3M0FXN2_9FLAO|nr:glycosyltransferase [Dokdonia sinensis]RMB57434.1 glycosyltransferase [Dokdonia sinensis]